MQGCGRQTDPDRLADREPLGVIDHEPLLADVDGIAVEPAWIRALLDPAAQHQAPALAGGLTSPAPACPAIRLAASLRKCATALPFTAPAT